MLTLLGFLTSKVGLYVVGAVAIVALAGGAYWFVYDKGQTDERNKNAATVLVETEAQRKAREANDAAARALGDDAALRCLRSPTGC